MDGFLLDDFLNGFFFCLHPSSNVYSDHIACYNLTDFGVHLCAVLGVDKALPSLNHCGQGKIL